MSTTRMPSSLGTMSIAIVGMAFEFPHGTDSDEKFLSVLKENRSLVQEIPKTRFNIDAYYNPSKTRTDTINTKRAHVLEEDPARFDAAFFSVPPEQAACMDPQQRRLLETAFLACENAGLTMKHMSGSRTAVAVASLGTHDFDRILHKDDQQLSSHGPMGNSEALLANRISHFLDLRGPSFSIDTACSGSLVALHLACQSLRTGESDLALVAGSSIILEPNTFLGLSNAGFLSPEGLSRSFDHRANGYGRGEGVGVLVIQRLEDAVSNGNAIRSVIRSTAVNSNGRTPVLSQPSSDAQQRLIKETYALAGLDLQDTGYVEAHGTGTAIGDPIEANALGQVFSSSRPEHSPLALGSVKSNFGHLEAASGIAAVIKATLMAEHGFIPGIAGLKAVNPMIQSSRYNLLFPQQCRPWPNARLRRISINNFGFGGSNAHVILDDASSVLRDRNLLGIHHTIELCHKKNGPKSLSGARLCHTELHAYDSAKIAQPRTRPYVVPISANNERAFSRVCDALQQYCEKIVSEGRDSPMKFAQFCSTLIERRSLFKWRATFVAHSFEALVSSLATRRATPKRAPRTTSLTFVFTGQGAQWCCMGRSLLYYPVFRKSLMEATSYLQKLGCVWCLIDELDKEDDACLRRSAFSQPICTAVQVAIVDLMAYLGVRPDNAVGHSSGEVALAYCAGAISKESAWRIAYFRGMCSENVPSVKHSGGFAMLAVALSAEECAQRIHDLGLEPSVSIGCLNSPVNTTITGLKNSIDMLQSVFDEKFVFSRKLPVDCAYHSPYMQTICGDYQDRIGAIETPTQPPFGQHPIQLYSTVTGRPIGRDLMARSHYWAKNLISPVLFLPAMRQMLSQQPDLEDVSHAFLEIGPHAALRRPVREIIADQTPSMPHAYLSALQKDVDATKTIVEMASGLVLHGIHVDLQLLNDHASSSAGNNISYELPSYPFDHSNTVWTESRLSRLSRFRSSKRNLLLGLPDFNWISSEPCWRNVMKVKEQPWVKDHVIDGNAVFPAAGYLAMAIEALRTELVSTANFTAFVLKDVEFLRALHIDDREVPATELRLSFRPQPGPVNPLYPCWDFAIHGLTNQTWTLLCRGSAQVDPILDFNSVDVSASSTNDHQEMIMLEHVESLENSRWIVQSNQFYSNLEAFGYEYGEHFKLLQSIRFGKNGEASALIRLRDYLKTSHDEQDQPCVIHPTTLDSIIQVGFAALSEGGWQSLDTMVSTKIMSLWVSEQVLNTPNEDLLPISARYKRTGLREIDFNVTVFDTLNRKPLIIATGVRATSVSTQSPKRASNATDTRPFICSMLWKPDMDLMKHNELNRYFKSEFANIKASIAEVDLQEALVQYFLSSLFAEDPEIRPHASKPHLSRYIYWARTVSQDKRLQAARCRPESEMRQVVNQYRGQFTPLTDLIISTGKQLQSLVRGERDALEYIFEDGRAERSYRQLLGPSSRYISKYLEHLSHKNPDIKILEVGAGTGGVTFEVVQSLTREVQAGETVHLFADYTFTDVSSAFFEKGRSSLKDFASHMTFKTLDIAKDPAEQNFDPYSFDVLIAGAVLHIPASLANTLKNCRRLLKPGGKLIIVEQCNLRLSSNTFVFGLLPGWWNSSEAYRRETPLIDEQQWHQLLQDSGFSGSDMVFRCSQEQEYHQTSTIISTALKDPPSKLDGGMLPPLKILIGNSNNQMRLASLFELKLHSMSFNFEIVPFGTFKQASSTSATARHMYISLIEVDHDVLHTLDQSKLDKLKHLCLVSQRVVWINKGVAISKTDDPQKALIEGFLRSVFAERSDFKFTILSLAQTTSNDCLVDCICRMLSRLATGLDLEPQYTIEKGQMMLIPRVVPNADYNSSVAKCLSSPEPKSYQIPENAMPFAKLNIRYPGDLDSLSFQEDTLFDEAPGSGEVDIEIKAAGVNFKDVLISLGRVAGTSLGYEAAGIIRRIGPSTSYCVGDRVICFGNLGFGTFVRCNSRDVYAMPMQMSFEAAASLPIVFATAYISLHKCARISASDTVLVHAAAGGVGQAAVQLARLAGATVFATVSSDEKARFLSSAYGIPRSNIFYSRDTSFARAVMAATNDRGVDVILNSLPGELLRESLKLLACFGRFIEIGQRDIVQHAPLDMSLLAKNVSFHTVDLGLTLRERGLADAVRPSLDLVLQHPQHLWHPRPLTSFPPDKVGDALRFLASGKTPGKVIINYAHRATITVQPALRPKTLFRPDGTYVVAGGFGGVGVTMLNWMMLCGARNFLILSRSGRPNTGPARAFMQEAHRVGARVSHPACDIAEANSLRTIIAKETSTLPPIKGCIIASMVLKDTLLENMTIKNWNDVVSPKVRGSWNLHQVLPLDLDFFILLSSMAGVLGNRGQTNYTAGNTYQDALARHRISNGQRAVSINLGVILEAGYVAENTFANEFLSRGVSGIRNRELLAVMEILCDPTQTSIIDAAEAQVLLSPPSSPHAVGNGFEAPNWTKLPTLGIFLKLNAMKAGSTASAAGQNAGAIDYILAIQSASTEKTALKIVEDALQEKLQRVMSSSETKIDFSQEFFVLGIDSLMAVEVRNWFLQRFDVDFPTQSILSERSIRSFCLQCVQLARARTIQPL